jgi:hypothetical protein
MTEQAQQLPVGTIGRVVVVVVIAVMHGQFAQALARELAGAAAADMWVHFQRFLPVAFFGLGGQVVAVVIGAHDRTCYREVNA